MPTQDSFVSAAQAVTEWRAFARRLRVTAPNGDNITWTEYLNKYRYAGRADERTIVGPVAFPAFAEQILGFEIGQSLAAEVTGQEGRPDFTPADAVTHPFVFEVKGTDGRETLDGHEEQVTRYLIQGRARIKSVVLTNLYGLRVFELDPVNQTARETLKIDLRLLAIIPTDAQAAAHPHAQKLADFLNLYRFKVLTLAEKIQRVRQAPPWNPGLEVTSTDWVMRRLDSVVEAIRADVDAKVQAGHLLDPTILLPDDRPLVEHELRELDKRVGTSDKDALKRTLVDYINAPSSSRSRLALQQFISHTAFYTATRLLLVRAWEDTRLLDPAALYDGGFNDLMSTLMSVTEVVNTGFRRARSKYPDLFARHNAYSWYEPSESAYINAIYDLANTYLGNLSDDVLGEVYQRQLARVDRKQLGQYYTPRDIIKLIWDMVDAEMVSRQADDDERPLRILDVATGSGGFLVEAAARLRTRLNASRTAGAVVDLKEWLKEITDGLVGCDIQQFSAYLAELNLVLQFSPLLHGDASLRLPGLRVHCVDTLRLHNSEDSPLLGAFTEVVPRDASGLVSAKTSEERQDSLERIRDPHSSREWFDVTIGNPPYVGEKLIAQTIAELQRAHPYWKQFSAPHGDYLYFFLILGISKLRKGGRFGFITTEYWLKANGAAPLRSFLAEHTRIERIVLFRDLTLFPDAPGQHNMIVVGERVTDPTGASAERASSQRPKVSIYTGPARPRARQPILDAIREGRRAPAAIPVRTFTSQRDPAKLGAESWAEVTMTKAQLSRRDAIERIQPKAQMVISEGVIATPQTLKATHANLLSQAVLSSLGGPHSGAGIYVVTEDELDRLELEGGGFTAEELAHIHPIVNTRDVFPYGVVLPPHPKRLIWLPASHGGGKDGKEFPANMPTLEKHLKQFKPVLESTVERYGKGRLFRPWWSAHSPRTHLIEGHLPTGRWADLAVTARWGDRKLVTGLVPAKGLPLSGLHAITGSGETSAAYLVGLINSTPVQELAEALAPGSVSQDDIERLGLPQLDPAIANAVANYARDLADTVHGLVSVQGETWPSIQDALRSDITLSGDLTGAWVLKPKRSGWGTVESVSWCHFEIDGRVSGFVESVEVTDNALWQHLIVNFTRGRIAVDADELAGHDVLALLATLVRGLGKRATLAEVLALPLPVDARVLAEAWDSDEAVLLSMVSRYRDLRQKIDDLVALALDGAGR